ncbi:MULTISPECIES: sensor histidine kinase [Pedobacter]|uniref:histidine kinase n=1 Tax=Pedobacter heparinus (strain ATCC 13125 / DSM 2366 / CIP 104194 / JCM 7457 / NBRC 12017 / NCIMB 9290 / NRRL B-14731 / HIM 762-3) TaxID=485917 RepID=C6XZA8_PEDHD|nr:MULTISPECIES: HAMP domain-containing sensor histidine kinase [Pedobacter]ACU02590.1 ATP-binding region ATPase domain protein [Pedobacter heparinus DSM 2366]MBB5439920.1 two-component system phosphate regulon sensor histidine kinase PhoR [Pedobacter sp. AK017]
MASEKKDGYRKNFSLILTFIVLMSVLFLLSLGLAYRFSTKYIENEFVSEKVNVLEESIKAYNDFFQKKLPEVSYYNGYLDSATAASFVDTVLLEYPFVSKVVFYDSEVSNAPVSDGLNIGRFSFGPKNIYQFGSLVPLDSVQLFSRNNTRNFIVGDDFNTLGLKLVSYIEGLDTTRVPGQDELFSNFSIVRSNKITYLNIPRMEDLKVYKKMMRSRLAANPVYQQDMLSFQLDPYKIKIKNTRPLLYQYIKIEPLTYDPLDTTEVYLSTEITLPGPFSDYKLYFISSKSFIEKEVFSYFLPIAVAILLFYSIVVLVAFLIYRNLNINQKMFKLQYDFVNNLTHEFKTPVSVIKIAGNNIKSAAALTDRELKMYGKILDEEADKLNGLMNKLLAFTQIENKAIALNRDEIKMLDFLESTVESHRLKHPDFDFSYEVSGFTTFVTDPVLLGSLFDNLAENAYKYSPAERKKLHISARLIKGKVVFRFTDQGIGIPASEINNIFKKFFRIQNQYNQNGSVGLGLAFCKELVNFMKGEITVRSKVNKGTEFKIVLPYND